MVYISYKTLWQSAFDKMVSEGDIFKDLKFSQLKFQVHDT